MSSWPVSTVDWTVTIFTLQGGSTQSKLTPLQVSEDQVCRGAREARCINTIESKLSPELKTSVFPGYNFCHLLFTIQYECLQVSFWTKNSSFIGPIQNLHHVRPRKRCSVPCSLFGWCMFASWSCCPGVGGDVLLSAALPPRQSTNQSREPCWASQSQRRLAVGGDDI